MKKVSLERFIRIVNIALDEYELKTIPPSINNQQFTEVDRMNNPNTKHLYLIGTVDGCISNAFRREWTSF